MLKVKPGYGILERKWQMVFRMLDVNKDGVMSSADEVLMTKLFAKHFGLTGPMVEPVRRATSLIWRLLLGHKVTTAGKSAQMTELEFVRHMWSSYTQRREMLFKTIMKIADLLLFAADNNKDGHISFPEWEILLKVLGCNDQRTANFLFQFSQPNYWGYSTILGARQFIMNLIFDQDPHYFFKYESILEATGLVPNSKTNEIKHLTQPGIKHLTLPEIKHLTKPEIKQVLRQNVKPQKGIDNGNGLIDSEIQHLLFQVRKPKQ